MKIPSPAKKEQIDPAGLLTFRSKVIVTQPEWQGTPQEVKSLMSREGLQLFSLLMAKWGHVAEFKFNSESSCMASFMIITKMPNMCGSRLTHCINQDTMRDNEKPFWPPRKLLCKGSALIQSQANGVQPRHGQQHEFGHVTPDPAFNFQFPHL